MSISFLLWPMSAAYAVLILSLFSFQAECSLEGAEVRCNPNQIGYNAVAQKCPMHQVCTPRGVCELLEEPRPVVTRARHFRPIPSARIQPHKLVEGRCGKDFGKVKCDLQGNFGPCCSRRGWCGSSAVHCHPANGCQHGCITDPALTIQPREMPANNTEQTSEPLINTHQIFTSFSQPLPASKHEAPGDFRMAGDSGVPAMHAALMPNGKVVFLDKIENYTLLQLGNGEFAYSSEWDPVSGKVTPLAYKVGPSRPCFLQHWLSTTRLMPFAAAEHFSLLAPWYLLVETDLCHTSHHLFRTASTPFATSLGAHHREKTTPRTGLSLVMCSHRKDGTRLPRPCPMGLYSLPLVV